MTILELHVHKSKRFNLSKNDDFTYRPKSKIEVITGPSGIGKSTLLQYLLPWPVDKTDFYPGGYRIVTFIHNGNEYRAKSDSSGKHHLSKNGNPLCKGTTKKELMLTLEEEFGLSNFLFKVITGNLSFTQAMPSLRKEWITRLSSVDLTFAYRFYEAIKNDVKDLKGSKKITEAKLTDFSYSDKEEEAIGKLKRERDGLLEIKDILLKKDYPNIDNAIIERIKSLIVEIKSNLKKVTGIEEYKLLNTYPGKLERVERHIYMLTKELRRLSSFDNTDINKLESDIEKLERECEEIHSLNKYSIPTNELHNLVHYISNTDYRSWLTILETDVPELKCFDAFMLEYGKIKIKRDNLRSYIDGLRVEIKTLSEAGKNDNVICPNCKTSFKPNFSEKSLLAKTNLLKKREKEYDNISDAFLKMENLHQELQKSISAYRSLKLYIESNAILRQIFNTSGMFLGRNEEHDILNKTFPYKVDGVLTDILVYLSKAKQLPEMCDKLSSLKNERSAIRNLNQISVDQNKKKLELYSRQLVKLNKIKNRYLSLIEQKNKEDKLRTMLNDKTQQLLALKTYEETYENYIESLPIQEISNYLIEKITTLLKEIDLEIANIQSKKDKVAGYLSMLEETNNKIFILEEILKALDPKTGLIAESIEGSIGYVLSLVNNILASTFFYHIRVGIDRDNIDYKFKLIVNNVDGKQDISMGSSGQKEIIDFAFLLATYKILGLHYPLLLDEIGHRIDPMNRQKLFKYILEVDETEPNQIFMVSHNSFNQINSSKMHVTRLQ